MSRSPEQFYTTTMDYNYPKSHKERIDEVHNSAMELIEQKFPNMDEHEEVTKKVYNYAGTCEDVYMEIGLQCGFILAVQLLGNTQTK
ncbi:hypothetical protein [Paenibacillus senegalensis]|uniref:hypothetical protein n=1 Tax=Paenibacillus senegalensis TaxID=1465766 RepID=UPI0011DDDF02|nr:hypothetical protein [Paenibacillus senegalensis]